LTSLDVSNCCKGESSDSSNNIGLKISNFVANGGTDAALSYLNIGRNDLDFQGIKDLGKGTKSVKKSFILKFTIKMLFF
jgi:hypothetical protein